MPLPGAKKVLHRMLRLSESELSNKTESQIQQEMPRNKEAFEVGVSKKSETQSRWQKRIKNPAK